jgi:hypothetical protein
LYLLASALHENADLDVANCYAVQVFYISVVAHIFVREHDERLAAVVSPPEGAF